MTRSFKFPNEMDFTKTFSRLLPKTPKDLIQVRDPLGTVPIEKYSFPGLALRKVGGLPISTFYELSQASKIFCCQRSFRRAAPWRSTGVTCTRRTTTTASSALRVANSSSCAAACSSTRGSCTTRRPRARTPARRAEQTSTTRFVCSRGDADGRRRGGQTF